MPAAVRQPRAHGALDDAIRAIPSSWFRPSRAVYWADLLATSTLGWAAFVLAARTDGWPRAGWLVVTTGALYRAVLFIHELTHLSKRDVPFLALGWNAIVGVPLLIPSFLYEQVHTDHHRQRCYGTTADPEYVPYGRRSPLLMAGSVVAALFVPAAFVVRFGLLAPLGWMIPALRRMVSAHASALVINHQYVRKAPISAAGRVQEAAATLAIYLTAFLWMRGMVETRWIAQWLGVGAAISLVNALRTLAAHRYDIDDRDDVTMTEQLLDSCTVAPSNRLGPIAPAIRESVHALLAPVGLRYHALHHWIPSLPYHNLGRAHRRLLAALQADAPYRATVHHTASGALSDLARRAASQGRSRFRRRAAADDTAPES